MISSLFLSLATVLVLTGLLAFLDAKIEERWGADYSFPKSVLLLLATLSSIYQIGFIFYLPSIFWVVDGLACFTCLVFHKLILKKIKSYTRKLCLAPLYPLYFFLAYLFFLSVFSVQGWDWDSMIFHLSRPFLYLNEQTIFTTHYSDSRQVVWPMGGDVLFYLFTRHGETFGTGFISFLCYIATLAAIGTKLKPLVGARRTHALILVAASMPALVYSSNTVKGDPLAVFAFVMMWIAFVNFHNSRNRADLYTTVLAFAFGLSCKLTFLFAGGFSLLAFFLLEILDRRPWQLKGSRLPLTTFIPFLLLCILLSQLHLFIFNTLAFGHPAGPTAGLVHPMSGTTMLQNFSKYQIELADFVIPLSSVGIPFIDTFLAFLYNHTIGALTGDAPWQYRFFPQEMNASFGPFGFLIVWFGIYKTLFGKSNLIPRLLAATGLVYFLFIVFNFHREESISIIRYLAPVIVASIPLLPAVYNNPLLRFEKAIRWSCLSLLAFCIVANYAKPIIAYHPKAIPWFTYAFANRDLLYKEKHFFDDRISIFTQAVRPDDRILIISKPNVWMYPYYQNANGAKIRLHNLDRSLPNRMNDYIFIVCEHKKCIEIMDSGQGFKRIWRSATDIPRQAAYYRKKVLTTSRRSKVPMS